MGLTKQYLRYSPSGKFNIIANGNCNIVCITLEGQAGRYVAVGACEDIIIWDLRLGEKAQVISGEKHVVTHLCAAPDNRHIAAGYADGTVKTYDLKTGENVSTFSGHRTAITCLSYDLQGHRLASASKGTDIVIWDIVGETGINRLCGHKGVVTQVKFFEEHNILISSSKDTYVKFWDLDTAHCFKTLVSHKSEVWAFCLLRKDQYLVTGCGDNELRVWKIAFKDGEIATDNAWKVMNLEGLESLLPADDLENDSLSPLTCTKVGSVLRKGRGRVVSLKADATGQILLCHGNGNIVEVFYFKNEAESLEHFKKRQRKLKKRLSKISDSAEQTIEPVNIEQGLADEVTRLPIVTATSKVKSANLVIGGGKEIRVAICLNNNLIELHSIRGFTKDAECTCLRKIAAQGHHSEVRSLCFSSDNLAIASGSGESVKMWNRPSLTCLRTLETDYTLSICFAPGDRHVLVGMKDGQLVIADIAAGEILESVPAHTKELWTVSLTPDKRGCVTGSGDATVKFWQFELVNVPDSKAKVLSVLHKRTLKLEEGVLAVKMSPNSALIAVSLLDSTVKIFFVDTLKFFVSLYGHHLPVLCMDICHDSTLIVTGSADRNVKIWGLDFGDCHRSLFAHDDSITAIQFVPKTHHFFTCGKDGRVKYWDADTYNKILTLQAHHGEAWSLAVSPNGQYVASSGSDSVVRVFERTSEPVVLEDEAEEEREAEENAALATGEETIVPGQFNLNLPSKKTVGSEKAAERLLEAIDVYKEYKAELLTHKKVDDKASAPEVPILMTAYKTSNPEDFLIEILCGIRASDLEEALLLLPFTTVCEFISTLPALLARDHEIEVICRTMMFLLRMHHGPIVSNQGLLPVIKKLKKLAFSKLNKLRDMVGYNSYSLQFVQRELEERNSVQLFLDATVERKTRDKKRRKRERIAKTAVITL